MQLRYSTPKYDLELLQCGDGVTVLVGTYGNYVHEAILTLLYSISYVSFSYSYAINILNRELDSRFFPDHFTLSFLHTENKRFTFLQLRLVPSSSTDSTAHSHGDIQFIIDWA